jgi:hypothetical protein
MGSDPDDHSQESILGRYGRLSGPIIGARRFSIWEEK